MGDSEATVVQIEQAILRHVRAHPNAADTAEGIARWWLGSLAPEPTQSAVQEALDRLEVAGQIIRTVLVDGTVLYAAATPDRDPPGQAV